MKVLSWYSTGCDSRKMSLQVRIMLGSSRGFFQSMSMGSGETRRWWYISRRSSAGRMAVRYGIGAFFVALGLATELATSVTSDVGGKPWSRRDALVPCFVARDAFLTTILLRKPFLPFDDGDGSVGVDFIFGEEAGCNREDFVELADRADSEGRRNSDY
jgi:hypothetical protein